jgi:hypothetical protein
VTASRSGQEADGVAIDRRVVDRRSALFHHLLQVAVAKRTRCIPADAHKDDVDRKAHSFYVQLVDVASIRRNTLPRPGRLVPNATVPTWSRPVRPNRL